jgi:tetratricopeptide (TPR) repeat protein
MKIKPILVVSVLMLFVMVPLLGQAEEELFDTKAATQHLDQGITYLKAKKFDAAISEFETAADINPDAEAYYYLGYAYYLKGRTGDEESRNKSRENFERAYEIDPNFSPARFKPTEEVPARMEQPDQTAPPASEATPTLPGPDQGQQQDQEQQQPEPPADQAK